MSTLPLLDFVKPYLMCKLCNFDMAVISHLPITHITLEWKVFQAFALSKHHAIIQYNT